MIKTKEMLTLKTNSLIQVPEAFQQADDKHEFRKSAHEWATKQKSINDFQLFLEDNKNMVSQTGSTIIHLTT